MGGFTQLLTSTHYEISRGVHKLAQTSKILKKNIVKGSHFLLLHSKQGQIGFSTLSIFIFNIKLKVSLIYSLIHPLIVFQI